MSRPNWMLDTIQIDDGHFKAKVGHAIEVIGNHHYLPFSDMDGVSSIPPPLNKALHQGSTHGTFQNKAKDRLEARFLDVSPRFRNEEVVPLHHLIGTSATSIRG